MSSPKASPGRLLHVDALKAFAAQAIVLHHLAAYGPLADAAHELLPGLIEALYRHGRLAVQVFLVVGGFLSARSLSPHGGLMQGSPLELLWRRWLRLALPFMVAVALALACGALVRPWLPDLVPESVSLAQLLAHGLLLQGVLGHEALTVGAWYVAADFQLFAMLLAVMVLARSLRLSRPLRQLAAPLLVLALAAASLWGFNRMATLDDWAPYFFGAYGLGALVHWIGLTQRPGRYLALLSAVALAALAIEWRDRIALALLTAWLLAWLQGRHQRRARLVPAGCETVLAGAGTHSYALFLIHYPILLLVNALFDALQLQGALILMLVTWALANLAALPFYRWIEQPVSRLRLGAWTPSTLRV
ncbi:MAG: acyltransferase [Paucibacter sp.]|nr:acyltransferase [Roseateles sp.]